MLAIYHSVSICKMAYHRFILVVVVTLALCPMLVFGQTIMMEEEEVPVASFKIDVASPPAKYSGHYHFGFSEGESDLHLLVKGTSVSGTLTYDVYNEGKSDFDHRKVVLKGGHIIGNMLVADGWYGIFAQYRDRRGLILFKAPTNMIGLEFGYRVEYDH